jgi:DnaJ-class molecular chaperone
MICPDCDGEGRVEVEYTVGGVGPAGPWQGYVTRMVECERCRGWGVIEDEESDD